jgi:hypothetical protein
MFTDEKKTGEVQIDKIGKLMLRAAELLEQHGHTKLKLVDVNTGAMCWAGALSKAGVSDDIIDLIAVRMGFVPGPCERHAHAAMRWNDADETTGADVIDRLRRFA